MSEHANRELLDLMQRISLRHFYNDWESGLEYILWHWVHNDSPLSSHDKHRLYILHTRANGWFALNEETKEKEFISVEKWIKLFQEEFDGAVN